MNIIFLVGKSIRKPQRDVSQTQISINSKKDAKCHTKEPQITHNGGDVLRNMCNIGRTSTEHGECPLLVTKMLQFTVPHMTLEEH